MNWQALVDKNDSFATFSILYRSNNNYPPVHEPNVFIWKFTIASQKKCYLEEYLRMDAKKKKQNFKLFIFYNDDGMQD